MLKKLQNNLSFLKAIFLWAWMFCNKGKEASARQQ
jgi:hypothetical protein